MPFLRTHGRILALVLSLLVATSLLAGCTAQRRAWLPAQWDGLDAQQREDGVELTPGRKATLRYPDGSRHLHEVLAVGPDYLVVGRATNYGLETDTLTAADLTSITVSEFNELGKLGAGFFIIGLGAVVVLAILLSQADFSGMS